MSGQSRCWGQPEPKIRQASVHAAGCAHHAGWHLDRRAEPGAEVDPADMSQAIGVTSWVSWVVNLLTVEWWLHRRPLTSV